MKQRLFLVATFIFLGFTSLQAQVTIGSDIVPNAGALLDLKESAMAGKNSDKGLGLPRVELSDPNNLYPMFSAGYNTAENANHKGLVVYNLTTTSPFVEGLYMWNGSKWVTYNYSDGVGGIGAANGLTLDAKNIELGGTLNKATTITGSAVNTLTLNAPTTVSSTLGVISNATVGGTLNVTDNTTVGGYVWAGGVYAKDGALFSGHHYTGMNWNKINAGIGESEFVNAMGSGSGGFRFYCIKGFNKLVDFTNWIYFISPTGVTSANSDRRIKTEIEDIKLGLSDVMKLRPVKYNIHPDRKYKNGKFVLGEESYPQIGFIAQEVEAIIPDAVTKPEKEEEIWGLSYERLIPVLTKALQEQQAQIEKLEKRIDELEKSEK